MPSPLWLCSRLAAAARTIRRPFRPVVEAMEDRCLSAVTWQSLGPGPMANALIEAKAAQNFPAIEVRHAATLPVRNALTGRDPASLLPGTWGVQYDASGLFGPGALGSQEITFTGPRGPRTFVSTTGVVVNGFFGPAYYQFSSWGSYQFLSKRLVRLTITGASPTEYLDRGIIVMGGQFLPIQFLNRKQFRSGGAVYNRIS
jgi:hypothetical protein